MTETSRPWGSTTPGDAGPYTDDQWSDTWARLFANAVANAGVLKGARSEFAASGATSPVIVQPGAAVVDGKFHDSSANENVTVPTPAASTRIDRIVLRKTWATQLVRITRVAGVEGGGAPAISQSDGVTWDIPLWQVSITTGGAITFVADERVYTRFATETFTPELAGGRLTLTSATPVTTADVTAAATLYYTPFKHNRLAVYVNGAWRNVTFSEISLSLASLSASTIYDIWAYVNASGSLALEALAWSNSGAGTSARATALTTQDGIYVKTGDTSRRYLGSILTVSAGQTEDSAKRRYVFNYYNRIERPLYCADTANTWSYTTATWRAANASTTDGVGRFGILVGVAEDMLNFRNLTMSSITSAGSQQMSGGIGINATSADSSLIRTSHLTNPGDATEGSSLAEYQGYLAAGYHQIQRIEISSAGGTTLFYGIASDVAAHQPNSGMVGMIKG